MTTDTSILLLLADLQRDKAALQARVAELEQQLGQREQPPDQ